MEVVKYVFRVGRLWRHQAVCREKNRHAANLQILSAGFAMPFRSSLSDGYTSSISDSRAAAAFLRGVTPYRFRSSVPAIAPNLPGCAL